jgi:hypothetical protein
MWLYFVLPPQNTIYKKTKTNMKAILKYVLLVIGLTLMIIGCGVVKRQQEKNEFPFGTSMRITCNIENGTGACFATTFTPGIFVKSDKYPSLIYLGYEITVNIVAYLSLIIKLFTLNINPFGAICDLKFTWHHHLILSTHSAIKKTF